jgi:hypothetical protein
MLLLQLPQRVHHHSKPRKLAMTLVIAIDSHRIGSTVLVVYSRPL